MAPSGKRLLHALVAGAFLLSTTASAAPLVGRQEQPGMSTDPNASHGGYGYGAAVGGPHSVDETSSTSDGMFSKPSGPLVSPVSKPSGPLVSPMSKTETPYEHSPSSAHLAKSHHSHHKTIVPCYQAPTHTPPPKGIKSAYGHPDEQSKDATSTAPAYARPNEQSKGVPSATVTPAAAAHYGTGNGNIKRQIIAPIVEPVPVVDPVFGWWKRQSSNGYAAGPGPDDGSGQVPQDDTDDQGDDGYGDVGDGGDMNGGPNSNGSPADNGRSWPLGGGYADPGSSISSSSAYQPSPTDAYLPPTLTAPATGGPTNYPRQLDDGPDPIADTEGTGDYAPTAADANEGGEGYGPSIADDDDGVDDDSMKKRQYSDNGDESTSTDDDGSNWYPGGSPDNDGDDDQVEFRGGFNDKKRRQLMGKAGWDDSSDYDDGSNDDAGDTSTESSTGASTKDNDEGEEYDQRDDEGESNDEGWKRSVKWERE